MTDYSSNKKPRPEPSSARPSTKDWPELAPTYTAPTPEQALAKENLKLQGENARKLLIVRSRALLAAAVLMFLSVIQTAFYVIPAFWNGEMDIVTLLFVINMILSTAASVYFLKAKDPHFTTQLLKVMITINSLALLLGLARLVSLPLMLVILILLLVAYEKIKLLDRA